MDGATREEKKKKERGKKAADAAVREHCKKSHCGVDQREKERGGFIPIPVLASTARSSSGREEGEGEKKKEKEKKIVTPDWHLLLTRRTSCNLDDRPRGKRRKGRREGRRSPRPARPRKKCSRLPAAIPKGKRKEGTKGNTTASMERF